MQHASTRSLNNLPRNPFYHHALGRTLSQFDPKCEWYFWNILSPARLGDGSHSAKVADPRVRESGKTTEIRYCVWRWSVWSDGSILHDSRYSYAV
jgi:hypothetical protein